MHPHLTKVAVVGLGYVGLPLAVSLTRVGYNVTGVDINPNLIQRLRTGLVVNRDIPEDFFPVPDSLKLATTMPFDQDIYIVCVPTPHVDGQHHMDASAVIATCENIGHVISSGATVVIESTVTPGSTNGILRDAVARTKGDFNFHMAFSPERVNPGPAYDFYEARNNVKLIGCDDGCHEELQSLYLSIYSDVLLINVEEAELVKTFENAQRDLNIAMMNELSLQCYRKNLNLAHVVDGLRTKRTSPEFYPGMVGGHCIAVDPYFLAEYYETENCLSVYARRINEGYIRKLAGIAIDCNTARGPILIVGQSYKAGVVDKRNSGALKLLTYLQGLGVEVYLHDMLVHDSYDGPSPTLVIGAVNHDTDVDIHRVYRCGPLTNLLTVGLQFTATQCEPFHKVFQL